MKVQLIQRSIIEGDSHTASIWEKSDVFAPIIVDVSKSDYDLAKAGVLQLTKPDPAAKLLGYSCHLPLDSPTTKITVGDAVELDGRLFIKTGPDEDYTYWTVSETGGFYVRNSGHTLILEKGEYEGSIDKLTLLGRLDIDGKLQDIPGITIVDGMMTIDESIFYIYEKSDLGPSPAHKSISYDTLTYYEISSVDTVASFSHTCTGSDRALSVFCKWDSTDATASATYNGVSMTNKENTHSGILAALLAMSGTTPAEPASGSHTLALTVGLSFSRYCYARSLTGAGDIRGSVSATGSGTPSSITGTTVADDELCDYMACTSSFEPSAAGGQTNAADHGIGTNAWLASSQKSATTTSTTNQWTSSVLTTWVAMGVVFQPAGGGGTPVTVNLTGVSSAGQAGSLSATGAASVALTGVASAGQAGSVTVTGAASVALTGVASAGQAGSLSVTTGVNVQLTGVSSAGQVGSLTATGAANVTLTGVSSAGQAGNLSAGAATVVNLVGVSSSGQVGNLSVTGAALISLIGVSSTGQVGHLSVTVPTSWGYKKLMPTTNPASLRFGSSIPSPSNGEEPVLNSSQDLPIPADNTPVVPVVKKGHGLQKLK